MYLYTDRNMKKLVCTIGTQGLSDGRRIHRGEVYEVDDEIASTLIAARYAKEYVEPDVVDDVETPADQDDVAELPTDEWVVPAIKQYLDDAGIKYGIRMSKSELLELVERE
ncbi:MAG: hypothetical protein GWP10_16605 [Nitrospiraceae bacterium]|nr:hypothetical protein [Nitrospiraceae bacterium]